MAIKMTDVIVPHGCYGEGFGIGQDEARIFATSPCCGQPITRINDYNTWGLCSGCSKDWSESRTSGSWNIGFYILRSALTDPVKGAINEWIKGIITGGDRADPNIKIQIEVVK